MKERARHNAAKIADKIARLADSIERFADLTGALIAWLTLAMVLVTFLIVTLRYFFGIGFIWMQESVVWMHALVFLLAGAYTLRHDEHVRVDIFYRRMSPRARALVNLAGTLLLLVPVVVFILLTSLEFVGQAWRVRETSAESGGLPGVYLLKTAIPLTAILLLIQALAWVARSLVTLISPSAHDPDAKPVVHSKL